MAIGTVEEPQNADTAAKKKKKNTSETQKDPTVLYIAHGTGMICILFSAQLISFDCYHHYLRMYVPMYTEV